MRGGIGIFVCFLIWLTGTADSCAQPIPLPVRIETASRYRDDVPTRRVERDSQVRVTYEEGWRVLVFGVGNGLLLPVDTFDCAPARTVAWVGPPGSYIMLLLGPDPEDIQQVRVIVAEGQPGPDPDPGPGPNPPPPDPDTIPSAVKNRYGCGGPAYLAAIRVNRKTEAATLGKTYYDVAVALNEGRLTVPMAEGRVRQAREALGTHWDAWDEEVEVGLKKALEQYGQGILHYRTYFGEISSGLIEASKQ